MPAFCSLLLPSYNFVGKIDASQTIRDQPIMFLFLQLYYAAVLLKFTYYAQEEGLLSGYYAFYIQFCMSNSLHVIKIILKVLFY